MLKLAAIFKDHMVVQREKAITVFGTGEPGETVFVTLSTSKSHTIVKKDGTWCVSLCPLSSGEGYQMTVSCKETEIRIQDIAVGEVWLDSGQSNMELPLCDSENGTEACQAYTGSQIRFYQVPKCAVLNEAQKEQARDSAWHIANAENVGKMSAVAFYFASKLAAKMNCVIGIIDCYWGGTSITCWMSRSQLEKLTAGQKLLSNYQMLVGNKTEEQYTLEMQDYNTRYQDWQKRVEAVKQNHPQISWNEIHNICGECPWPQPAGWQSPFRPNGLYETMIRTVAPYTLRGFLYYQGEEDVQRYSCYCDMMQLLVQQWRRDWNDWNLPFLFVQLPMYIAADEADDYSWAFQREQQLLASKMIQNSGMVSLADCGEFDNIHPLDKKTPGERLAALAEQMVYHRNGTTTPTADQIYSDGKRLYIAFTDVSDKLVLRKTNCPTFWISGADEKFVPAQVKLLSNHLLCAESESIENPQALRYAWYNFGEASLFTESGTAISPFRKSLFLQT